MFLNFGIIMFLSTDDVLQTVFKYLIQMSYNFIESMLMKLIKLMYNTFIMDLLTNTTETFNNDTVIKLKEPIAAVAYSLVALFFVIEFCKQSVYFENMTIERFLKPIVMLVIVKLLISTSGYLLSTINDVSVNLSTAIINAEANNIKNQGDDITGELEKNLKSMSGVIDAVEAEDEDAVKEAENAGYNFPEDKSEGLDNAEEAGKKAWDNIENETEVNEDYKFKDESFMEALGRLLFSIIMILATCILLLVFVCLISVILIVRFFEIIVLNIVSPIFFATLASDTSTDVFKNFIKYYIVVCFQIVIISVCLALLPKINSGSLMPIKLHNESIGAGLILATLSSSLGATIVMIFGTLQMSVVVMIAFKSKSFLGKLIGIK